MARTSPTDRSSVSTPRDRCACSPAAVDLPTSSSTSSDTSCDALDSQPGLAGVAGWLAGDYEALDGVDDRADLGVVRVARFDERRHETDRFADPGVVTEPVEQRRELAGRQRRAHRVGQCAG